MDKRLIINRHGNMTVPKNQIAARNVGPRNIGANQFGALHVTVTGARDIAGRQRRLHKAGTINTQRGVATPQIGHPKM